MRAGSMVSSGPGLGAGMDGGSRAARHEGWGGLMPEGVCSDAWTVAPWFLQPGMGKKQGGEAVMDGGLQLLAGAGSGTRICRILKQFRGVRGAGDQTDVPGMRLYNT